MCVGMAAKISVEQRYIYVYNLKGTKFTWIFYNVLACCGFVVVLPSASSHYNNNIICTADVLSLSDAMIDDLPPLISCPNNPDSNRI